MAAASVTSWASNVAANGANVAIAAIAATPPPTEKKNHNMPPSKVIHCRAVAEGCKETDLVHVMKMFGNVKALKLMPKICQGLVEFDELESAIGCVTYSNTQPILVHGRQMYVNYSKSTEINRNFSNTIQGNTPTNILLFTVLNVIHPVNVDTIKKICEQQNTEVQRIVIFHKNGLQALVEFKTIEDASRIQQALNGCDIYPGCCTLKIEFSKTAKLNVRTNNAESYNIEVGENSISPFPQSNKRKFSDLEGGVKSTPDVSALLAGAEGFPAVQSILAKVMNSDHSHNPSQVKTLISNNSMYGYGDANANDYSTNMQSNHQLHEGGYANYGEQNQSSYLDQYTTPFTDIGSNGNNAAGGEGCVAMVYGINNEVMNCGHLYNLFCLYGNVVKVKVLVNKPGCAMVQYADRLSTEMAIQYLNNLTLFGQPFLISFSKHPFIVDSQQTSPLFDGSSSVVSYTESRNNRFKYVAGGRNDLFSRIHPPSKVLHYFNAPPECTEQRLEQLFQSFNAEVPLKQATISKPSRKSSLGLLEFSSISASVEALMLVNHVTLNKDDALTESTGEKAGAPFTFKLAFSQSNTINK